VCVLGACQAVWFDDATTGELRPGKGVTLKLESLPQIVAALSGLIEGAGDGR